MSTVLTQTQIKELIAAAQMAREQAYAPYSNFHVGAAILGTSGKVFAGCNVENASYGLTICAERVAVGNAVAAGERGIAAIAVVAKEHELVRPCGACLQVLAEFSSPDAPMLIICAALNGTHEIRPLTDYLPFQFNLPQ